MIGDSLKSLASEDIKTTQMDPEVKKMVNFDDISVIEQRQNLNMTLDITNSDIHATQGLPLSHMTTVTEQDRFKPELEIKFERPAAAEFIPRKITKKPN